MPGEAGHETEICCATGFYKPTVGVRPSGRRFTALELARSIAAWRAIKGFANVQIIRSTTLSPDLVFRGQTTALRHGYGKDYWDMNSLVGFAPPNHFEALANGDTSWAFDATSLV
jgi:hypothetical protein